jgi:translation initiation factor IF-3
MIWGRCPWTRCFRAFTRRWRRAADERVSSGALRAARFVFFSLDGDFTIAQEKAPRINGEIIATEIRLVGEEGEQLGIVALSDAVARAEAAELDLVEIAPMAKPPVCRIMDYGKFKYREAKKQHEAKLKLKQIQVKEVKFRPGTDEGDYQIKLRNLIRFLGEGDKAKITLRFRGREMAHQEFGVRLLERIRNDLETHCVVESWPRLEGRQMVMLLAPKKVVPKVHHPTKPEAGSKASPSESTAVGSK